MKGNMKGFTLVELLAVIVILAIIALITIPAILNVINDARLKGAEDKAWGTIDAVRMAYTQEQGLGGGQVTDESGSYTVCFADGCDTSGGGHHLLVGGTQVKMSGEAPSSGTVSIDLGEGTISCQNLLFTANGTYTCTSDGNKMCCKPGEVEVDSVSACS